MKIEQQVYFDFDDVLIKPKRSNLGSRSEVSLERTFTFLHSKRTWTGVPILTANMDTTGTFEMYDSLSKHKIITIFHKHYTVDDYNRKKGSLDKNYYSITTGITELDYTKTKTLITMLDPFFLTIDVANGYSSKFIEFCKQVRQDYPKLTIFAGNVATGESVQELLLNAGVDVVKCGIGSGSVCSTRLKTGVGVPQLSVCLNCSEVANGLNGHIISDGGCKLPGDVAKAFGSGAHFVMLGGVLAGHNESGGETIKEKDTDGNIIKYKLFYGMSSEHAQNIYNKGLKNYRSSEGKKRKIPYRGPVDATILDILGGLRSTGTYIGAARLKDFAKCCTFLQVNRQVNHIFDTPTYTV